MKYFLHDTSAFDDEKVSELFIEFGYEGVGLFYVALEKMGKQEKPVKTEVLKKQLRIGKRLEKCWNFMESLGIISSNNGETFNKQLLNFSEKYKIKSEKNAKRISEWREKQKDTENVTRYESVRNTPKVNRSKVNRSKENNIDRFIAPDLFDVEVYFQEHNFSFELAKRFYDSYSVNNWKDSKGNQVRNWKQKAQMVWFKDENKQVNSFKQPEVSKVYKLKNDLDIALERALINIEKEENEQRNS